MGLKNIRLASTLAFDEEQEADIINIIETFNSSHRMGAFMSSLLRIAFENPEIVVAKNGSYEPGELVKTIEKLGKTPTRHNYMNEINKKVYDMQLKIDEMYEMCLRMYTMLEIGKRLGVKEKTENMILAQFTIEQQLDKFKKILGVDCKNTPFASNRLISAEKRADATLDYIISCYEPIINELRKELKVSHKEIEIPVIKITESNTIVNQTKGNIEDTVEKEVKNEVQKPKLTDIDNIDSIDDEVIDFDSNADMAALENFFND